MKIPIWTPVNVLPNHENLQGEQGIFPTRTHNQAVMDWGQTRFRI